MTIHGTRDKQMKEVPCAIPTKQGVRCREMGGEWAEAGRGTQGGDFNKAPELSPPAAWGAWPGAVGRGG